MKKGLFYSALLALILANVIVYSCQKENPKDLAKIPTSVSENAAVDRNMLCQEITITHGTNLLLCGVDSGSDCSMCGGNYHQVTVPDDIEVYPFANSSVYYICNPTPANITYEVTFNCANQSPQQFVAPALTSITYHVDAINNGFNWCCFAHAGCSH